MVLITNNPKKFALSYTVLSVDKFQNSLITKSSAEKFIRFLVKKEIPQLLFEDIRVKKHPHKLIPLFGVQIFFNLSLNQTFCEVLFQERHTKENLVSLLLVILKSPARPLVAGIILEIFLGRLRLQFKRHAIEILPYTNKQCSRSSTSTSTSKRPSSNWE